MDVVKVATAMSGLTVSDKGGTTFAKTTTGQEGRVQEVLAHAQADASLGQVDQVGALDAPLGQEGRDQGLMVSDPAGASLGQEDQAGARVASGERDGQGKKPLEDLHHGGLLDQVGQVRHTSSLGQSLLEDPMPKCSQALGISSLVPNHGAVADGLLFQPGVLEALTNTVAGRMGTAGSEPENNFMRFKFSAGKNHTKGSSKKEIKRKGEQPEWRMLARKY